MDDGVRFLPQYANTVTNTSTQVRTLDFWSIDLNAYLLEDKLTLSAMAHELGFETEARSWDASAAILRVRLQETFFVAGKGSPSQRSTEVGARTGFFSDVYFNGTALPIRGCEGYAALFAKAATLAQATQVAETLRDPEEFLLNFSLPSVSKSNQFYNPDGYWKGPTWVDQTWFAYTGLRRYQSMAKQQGDAESEAFLSDLASTLRRRLFSQCKSLSSGDSTPLSEHYHPETGSPRGATHFSWTAAHVLMWIEENARDKTVWI
mmetsp:Transcript_46938/g.109862  ORF Transcript_46938/g.109862 Transcript_46938/m.109862 type:complete len:263 (+) Transcript_46938:1-789(+)